MYDLKKIDRIKKIENVEEACVSKAEYAAEELLDYYDRSGLPTRPLFEKLLTMSDEEIIEMYLNI